MGKHLMEVKADVEGKPYLEYWKGEIWYVTDDDGDDAEFFSERPTTPGITRRADFDNWPDRYTVRVGNLDGGDSLVVENRNALGEVWVRSEDDGRFWRLECAG
jgi:hypothetical protein